MKRIFLLLIAILIFSTAAFGQEIENSSRSTIGYVLSDGTVENSSRSTIGYAKDVKMEHTAAFFFFFFQTAKIGVCSFQTISASSKPATSSPMKSAAQVPCNLIESTLDF
jgi:hypothetical protein